MGAFQDLRGRVFGRLTVMDRTERVTHNGRSFFRWICRCECGTVNIMIHPTSLKNGNTRSCGCLRRESIGRVNYKHGRSRSKEYITWQNMISRCHDIRDKQYPDWGGRGIVVCPEWQVDFSAFFRDMGAAPTAGHSIERVDNDGPYSRENCRWIPRGDQSRNTRRNRFLEYGGKRMIMSDWAREIGTAPSVLHNRLKRGLTVEQALTAPLTARGQGVHRNRSADGD